MSRPISPSENPSRLKKNSLSGGSPSTATLCAKSTVMAAEKRSSVKLLSRPTAYSESRTARAPKPYAGRAGPGRRGAARAGGEGSLGRPDRPRWRRESLRLQKMGDQEGHFDRLLRIEARIAKSVIPIMQISFRND